jgi:lipopolysaccharide transport system ATP-binding protein
MKAALRIDSLSKEYRLGTAARGEYHTFRESLSGLATMPWRWLRHKVRPQEGSEDAPGTLWALRDVSFEVSPGQVVAIIGSNGAGKSTLLKVLSRITEPTRGRAEVRGRIGSLLEVGTGFHAELTGRENIYLSGAILGMSRREIRRKFDEIVAFSEIEQFLDTPVKRYSSGMYVRLAFAVAAHLEPEILVVDEVLAVGDAAFQKKCLQRMQDAGRQGQTILFVSHNLAALQTLCNRGIVLERGQVVEDGPVGDAVSHYLRKIAARSVTELSQRTDRSGAGRIRLTQVEIQGDGASESGQLVMGHPARFLFHFRPALTDVTCIFTIVNEHGGIVTRFNSALGHLEDTRRQAVEPVIVCRVEEMLLAAGRYRLDVALLAAAEVQDRVEAAAFFDVVRAAVRGREPARVSDWVVHLPHHWEHA